MLVLVAAWIGVRWYSAEYGTAMEHVPLFPSLNARELRAVTRSASRGEFPRAPRIVTEGELEDGSFLIDRGQLTVTVHGVRKATLGPGAYFGERPESDLSP